VLHDLRIGEHDVEVGHCLPDSEGKYVFCESQVDQHVEELTIVCRRQEDVLTAGQLARRALKPKRLTLVVGNKASSLSAMSVLLATEQHHPMFQRVQKLTFVGRLPVEMPQVSRIRIHWLMLIALLPHCWQHWLVQHGCNVSWIAVQLLHRMCLQLCLT
jgi:hypothetical protein